MIDATMPPRRRVGLALGGGVVRGLAHVGVMTVLEEAGIPVDYVAGTSAGSIMGCFFCAGMSVKEIKEKAMRLRWWHLARPVWPRLGFVTFDPLAHWLTNLIGDVEFKDLKLPFAAVATDMRTGRPVRMTAGKVAKAVQASCSVPGFVAPVELNGMLLGDGSLANTIPVNDLRDMGADYVIGVDIFTAALRKRWGPFGMGFAAIEILIERAGRGIDDADCLISPQLGGKTYLNFSKREEFFRLGEDATRLQLERIRRDLELEPVASR